MKVSYSEALLWRSCGVFLADCRIEKSCTLPQLFLSRHLTCGYASRHGLEAPGEVSTLFLYHPIEVALRVTAFWACVSLYTQIKTLHLSAPLRRGRPKENQSGRSSLGAEAVIKRCGRHSRTPAPAVPKLCPRRIDFYTLNNTSEPPCERVDSLPSLCYVPALAPSPMKADWSVCTCARAALLLATGGCN